MQDVLELEQHRPVWERHAARPLPRAIARPAPAKPRRRVFDRALTAVISLYAAALLFFVWLTKDLSIASLSHDPLFAGYSVAVVFYVLSRFVLSVLYRPYPDVGYRPTLSIIIPAFNEQDGIAGTIESCLAADYPDELLEVVVVNDGSTDATWDRIVDTKARHPQIRAIDLRRNYGKRGAMAEGLRRSSGDVVCFVDSDSYLERDAAIAIVQPFADERVGAVVGHAYVANAHRNWLTKMQEVRYYSAFRVIKGTESVLGGNVICASGCCSAYRRSALAPILDEWEFQTFLGRPATFGDDRALTNRVLRSHRVVYQETARSRTVVPERTRVFLRQQLRWKKSWLRESMTVARFFWRKHTLAALLTYASIVFPFIAPLVVARAVLVRLLTRTTGDGMWFYLVGTYTMALLYCLYYAMKRRDGMWHHGLSFVAIYMGALVFQTYWAIATMRDNRWGTRDSTVKQERIDPRTVVDLRGGTVPGLEIHQRPPRLPWNAVPHEKRRRQAVAGLVMLALSVVPFHVYFTRTQEGGLLWAKASTSFAPVRTASLTPDDRAYAVAHAPAYRGAVALLVYHGLGRGSDAEGSGRFTIAPSRFAEQLSMLKAAGMRAVTARDVALAVTGRRRLPPNALMISFDDGRTDAMLYADPILRRLGMRATMFVITGQASERGLYYVPWTKLRGYARSGRWDLESHSARAHHEVRVAGRTLPALTAVGRGEGIGRYTRRVRADLAEASRTIARETGVRPLAFAYPFGAYAGPYDARTNDPRLGGILERTVRERYVVSFNQDDQSTWAPSSCADDPHRLRRLEVGDWTGRALLSRIASAAAGFGEPECAKTTPATVPEPAAAPSTKAPEAPAGFAPAPPARAPALRIQVPAVPSVVASAADAPTIVRPDPTDAPRATPAPTPRVTPAPTPRVTPAPTPRVTARPTASPPRGHGPPPGVPRGGPRA